MQSPPRKRRRAGTNPTIRGGADTTFFGQADTSNDAGQQEDGQPWVDVPINDEQLEEENISGFTGILKTPPRFDKFGNPILVFVDVSGVHFLPVHSCSCLTDTPPSERLIRSRFYPASHVDPRTVFTFEVLDDFLLQNKECHTSVANYYSKLRRMTSNWYPQLVIVSKHDWNSEMTKLTFLLRIVNVSLDGSLVNGEVSKHEHSMDLDINLALNPALENSHLNVLLARIQESIWTMIGERIRKCTHHSLLPTTNPLHSDQGKYMQKIMVDGWFKAKHLNMRNPWDDVSLDDGHTFTVTTEPYREHLKNAYHRNQVGDVELWLRRWILISGAGRRSVHVIVTMPQKVQINLVETLNQRELQLSAVFMVALSLTQWLISKKASSECHLHS